MRITHRHCIGFSIGVVIAAAIANDQATVFEFTAAIVVILGIRAID